MKKEKLEKSNFKKILSPKKLYGRESELKIIFNIFKRIRNGKKELFLVSGYSGIGKTALINEAQINIVKNNGCFISGKFDQLKRNIPYNAIIQVFQNLIDQILSKEKKEINIWKKKILNALGPNGQVIINIIPELELLIGKQPEIPELGLIENQNRFKLYFEKFTYVFCTPDCPLVMFIDDLQWADLASLTLIKNIITNSDIKYFLLIGAYRDNEVDNTHPLYLILNDIKKTKTSLNELFLNSLKRDNIDKLLMDILETEINYISELSDIIYKKTDGNPFFIYEFINILFQEKLISLSELKNKSSNNNKNKWHWNINEINKKIATDNVGDILTKKLLNLSKENQKIILLCACLGNRFDLKTFSLVNHCNEIDAIHLLSPIVKGGFIFFADSFYYFVHDYVQKTAYSLLNDQQKKIYHYNIGTIMLGNISNESFQKNIFFIIDQLNSGSDNIEKESELNKVIKINLLAGKKAKESTAYESALKYFKKGINLLGINSWDKQYDLTLSFFNETAEAAFLNADYDYMNNIINKIVSNAKILLDKVKSYEIQILAFIAQYDHIAAVNTGCDILKKLGMSLNKKPTKLEVILEILKTNLVVKGKNTNDLRKLPEMVNPYQKAVINILLTTGTAAYHFIPDLIPIMVSKGLRFVLKYGNSPNSSYSYASYGLVLAGILGNIDKGYEYGKFSLSLINSKKTHKLYAKIHLIFNLFIKFWKKHLNTTLDYLLDVFQKGLEIGDMEYAALSVLNYCVNSIYCGKNLSFVNNELEKYSKICLKLSQERISYSIIVKRQFVQNLIGNVINVKKMIGTCINENETFKILENVKDNTNIGILYLYKTILNYLFYDYKGAFLNIIIAKKYAKSFLGLIHYPVYIFYFSLILTSYYYSFSFLNKLKYNYIISKNQKMMKKWAKHCPENFLHKYYIVEAERCKINKQKIKAIDFYEKAVLSAHNNKYINEEAIAHELAAKFCFENSLDKMGINFIKNAYDCYNKWGAVSKTHHLEENYPDFINKK